MSVRISILAVALWAAAAPLWAVPLTLQQCLQQAAETNSALKSVAHEQTLATAQTEQARSGYLPRIDLTAGFTLLHDPQAVIMGNVTAETQERSFPSASLAVTQTISDFGRTSARISRAEALSRSAAASYRAATSDLSLQVIEAYFGILEGEKLIRASDDEVIQMSDHLRVASTLLEQGVVTRNDQLQASVRLAASSQRRLTLVNLLENRWAALNYLMGRPLDSRSELAEPPLAAPVELATAVNDRVVRPEMAARLEQVKAAESGLREASSSFYPELFTRLSADYVENRHAREQTLYTASIGLRINLFDGFLTTAQRQQALTRLRQEEDRLHDLNARLHLELVQAANDLRVARERIAVTEKAIEQSEENLRINRDRYQEQVGTATEVLDAQTLLTQAKTDYYSAIYDYQVAAARLQRAQGTL